MHTRALMSAVLPLLVALQVAPGSARLTPPSPAEQHGSRGGSIDDCRAPIIRDIFDVITPETLGLAWEAIVRDSLGYDLWVWHSNIQGIPPVDSLNSADLVIWTTGGDTLDGPGDRSCLTPAEEETLLTYLTAPPPGVTPRLYLESLDYLDEQDTTSNALSPLATALGIAAIDTLDVFKQEFTVYSCGPPGSYRHFEVGFHTSAALVFNQSDGYLTLAGAQKIFRAQDGGGVTRTVGHFYSNETYSVTFATYLLSSMTELDDPVLYPSDPVSYVRISLSNTGKPPVIQIGPDPGDSLISVFPGDTIRLDTEIANCMNAPYGDRTPQHRMVGFGIHAGILDPESREVVQQFPKRSIKRVDARQGRRYLCELPLDPAIEPGDYVLLQEVGYLFRTDTLSARHFRLRVRPLPPSPPPDPRQRPAWRPIAAGARP